ncbi:hypothetical protein CAPTEDRAFT_186537 [Capitella teleta]|uniref:Uncharacterized protein n=1 Tax=Capitella teleta TaxID=283909 RepID=R7V913_CAPTE|nr:hypothetical protein CAPTEDRAFT_186537 [Capitella teleta]|eukprot:ELU12851.1 hypothetical protein CAPTEDRAFT_186537 [Capitella teleta]
MTESTICHPHSQGERLSFSSTVALSQPAQLMFNRSIKSRIPRAKNQTETKENNTQQIHDAIQKRQNEQKNNFDKHAGKEKKKLAIGDHVRFKGPKGEWKRGTITLIKAPREVKNMTNGQYTCNWRHIFRTMDTKAEAEVNLSTIPEDEPEETPILPPIAPTSPTRPGAVITRSGRISVPLRRMDLCMTFE